MFVFGKSKSGLQACRSAPHRAVVALLSIALEKREYATLKKDLAASKTEQIAEIAQYHSVDSVIATAWSRIPEIKSWISRDLRHEFNQLQNDSASRRINLLEQLQIINSASAGTGLQLIALKGTNELLAPYSKKSGYRYINNLDFLVNATDFRSLTKMFVNLDAHPMAPAPRSKQQGDGTIRFSHEGWPGSVILHSHLGAGLADPLQSNARVMGRLKKSRFENIRLMHPEDRIIHLVTDAQIHSGRHRRFEFRLRDCMELINIASSPDAENISYAAARFESRGAGEIFSGITSVTEDLFLNSSMSMAPTSNPSWANSAIRKLGRHPRRKLASKILN